MASKVSVTAAANEVGGGGELHVVVGYGHCGIVII